MTPGRRVALQVAAAAVAAAFLGLLLTQSRLYARVRPFDDVIPGVAWKDVVAFGLPFALLVWVFVVRRGATTSLVGVLTAAVLVVGHAWSRLDWTVFVSRGTDLAKGGLPSPALAAALVVPFVAVALYHAVRRRGHLRKAYAEKGAEPDDVEAVRRANLAHGLVLVASTLVVALVVLGGVLVAGRYADATLARGSTSVLLAGGALLALALGIAVAARVLGWRAKAA